MDTNPAIRRRSHSSLNIRPNSELSTEAWTGSITGKRGNTLLKKELEHVTHLRNSLRSESCDLSNAASVRSMTGAQAARRLPALSSSSSSVKHLHSLSATTTSSSHRRISSSLHSQREAPSKGTTTPTNISALPARAQTGRSRSTGVSEATYDPSTSFGTPSVASTPLTGRFLGTLSRPGTIKRAAAGRQPQAGLCLIWNRGRQPGDFKEPERTPSQAAQRAEVEQSRCAFPTAMSTRYALGGHLC